MSWLTNAMMLFLIGIMVFMIGIPLLASLLPWRYAEGVVDQYQKIAISLVGKAIMLQRSHGGLALKKAKFDPQVGAMWIRIGGEKQYFEDPKNYMTTFKGRPFGLAHEDRATIVDARMAYLARRFRELREAGRFEDDTKGFKAFFSIPEGERVLVNLADIKAIVQKSASPRAVTREKTIAEKSQEAFNSTNIVDTMTYLISLGAGMGLMWLAAEFAARSSGGGGGGSVIPIVLGWPI